MQPLLSQRSACRAGGVARTPLEELQVALDAMCIMQAPFHHRYHLYSAVHRRVGGQGIVQFAGISGMHDRVWPLAGVCDPL